MSVEALVDAIEAAVGRCEGASCGNPRYFAGMFAGTMSANAETERIALEELLVAVERIAVRQAEARREAERAFARRVLGA